jgi:hypothetical protein
VASGSLLRGVGVLDMHQDDAGRILRSRHSVGEVRMVDRLRGANLANSLGRPRCASRVFNVPPCAAWTGDVMEWAGQIEGSVQSCLSLLGIRPKLHLGLGPAIMCGHR